MAGGEIALIESDSFSSNRLVAAGGFSKIKSEAHDTIFWPQHMTAKEKLKSLIICLVSELPLAC